MKKYFHLLLAAVSYGALSVFLPILFTSCHRDSEIEIFPVEMGNKWGFIDSKGQYVVNPIMDDTDYFHCGLARVYYQGKIGYINHKGNFKIPADYLGGTFFSEDVAFVTRPGEVPSCINKSGKVLFIVENAEYVCWFSEGLARFSTEDNLIGFIDKKGKVVIEPKFTDAADFKEGFSKVRIGDKWCFIKKDGEKAFNSEYDDAKDFSEGLAPVKIGEEWGFIDSKGLIKINPQFDEADPFSEGLAVVKIGDCFGYVDKNGKYVINPQFIHAKAFHNGMAVVTMDNDASELEFGCGFINKKGEIVINPNYLVALDFIGNYALVGKFSEKVGIIDKKGKYAVKPQFDDTKLHSHSSAVRSNYYNAQNFLDDFFNKYGDDAAYGFSNSTTLAEVKTKHSFSNGPADSTAAFSFKNPERIRGVAVDEIVFGFDRKSYELVENYVHTGWFTYRDGWKRSYFGDCRLKALEYHFSLEGIAQSKSTTLAKSIASALAKHINSEISENGSVFIVPKTNKGISYEVSYDERGTKLKVILSE